eukprot:TRINITY_DN3304_c0_g1_i4.p1 TRINITY_DN3304_c0_g1~~TRINITY_DN3304_c0_g1_i4.p1  ORF type:complete len:1640 (-),score=340.10 TRINITY_DN3304_c0_g1_i4:13-4932(-)
MTLRFLKKRLSTSGERSYEFDRKKYNHHVITLDDKQTASYALSHSATPGLVRSNFPLLNSFALAYFEVYIVNSGKDASLAVGLTLDSDVLDQLPGCFRGSMGYHQNGFKYHNTGSSHTTTYPFFLSHYTSVNSFVAGPTSSSSKSQNGEPYGPTFQTGDVIGVGLDNVNHKVFFTKNGQMLGVAFKKVGTSDWYPCVGMRSPGQTIIINFAPPFIFDRTKYSDGALTTEEPKLTQMIHSASSPAALNCIPLDGATASSLTHWDITRCGKCLLVYPANLNKISVSTEPCYHNAIGVVQSTKPFSFATAVDHFSYFEVHIDRLEGHMSIGLANHEYPLNLHIGWVKRSYGYHSDDGRRFKWKEHDSGTNDGEPYGPPFRTGDTVGCGYSLATRQIYFTRNGISLGPAYSSVYGVLYPSVALSGSADTITATFSPPFRYMPPSPVPSSLSSSASSMSGGTVAQSAGDADSPVAVPSISQISSSAPTISFLAPSSPLPSVSSPDIQVPEHPMGSGSNGISSSLLLPPPTWAKIGSPGGSPSPLSPSGRPHSVTTATSAHSHGNLMGSNPAGMPTPSPRPNSYHFSTPFPIVPAAHVPSASPPTTSPIADHVPTARASTVGMSSGINSSSGIANSSSNAILAETQRDLLWRRCGKSMRIKDDITVTMYKKKSCVVQASRPFSFANPLNYFECYVEGIESRKGSCAIGLTIEDYPLNKQVGKEPRSYGYLSLDGRKYRGDDSGSEYSAPFTGGDVVGCGLNGHTREIFFTRNGEFLGVAFWGIPEIPLFPSLSLRGAVGSTAVVSFTPPFRFNMDLLPGMSPSIWNLPLGFPTQDSFFWKSGYQVWTPSDVGVWLEAIGYGQYRDTWFSAGVAGRHLQSLSHTLMKDELGIEKYGHRADILNHARRLINSWRERAGILGEAMPEEEVLPTTPDSGSRGASRERERDKSNSVPNTNNPNNNSSGSVGKGDSRGRNRSASNGDNSGRGDPYAFNDPFGLDGDGDWVWVREERSPSQGSGGQAHGYHPPHGPHVQQQQQQAAHPRHHGNEAAPAMYTYEPEGVELEHVLEPGIHHAEHFTHFQPYHQHPYHQAYPPGQFISKGHPLQHPPYVHHMYPPQWPGGNASSSTQTSPMPRGHSRSRSDGIDVIMGNLPNNGNGNGNGNHPTQAAGTSGSNNNNNSASVPKSNNNNNGSGWSRSDTLHSSLEHQAPVFTVTPPYAPGHQNPYAPHHNIHVSAPMVLLPSHPVLAPSSQALLPPLPPSMTSSTSSTSSSTSTSSSNLADSDNATPGGADWEIPYDELEFGVVVGKGFFGEVKHGSWRDTDVAIKIIYRDSFKSRSSYEMFQNEVRILSRLRHPNIVQFLGACTSLDHQVIVTEWMSGGSLRQFLVDHFKMLDRYPQQRLKMALDIARGMTYLHDRPQPILHRDLSTRNILLDYDAGRDLGSTVANNAMTDQERAQFLGGLKCKVADFGLSRLKLESGSMTASVGCIPYMAPEVYKGESNSEKSDVYSFSMILWELWTGQEPQQEMKPMKMAHLAAHEGYRPVLPLHTPPLWRDLITVCWANEPERRPSFKQIISRLRTMSPTSPSPAHTLPVGVPTLVHQHTVSIDAALAAEPLPHDLARQFDNMGVAPAPAPVLADNNVGEYV